MKQARQMLLLHCWEWSYTPSTRQWTRSVILTTQDPSSNCKWRSLASSVVIQNWTLPPPTSHLLNPPPIHWYILSHFHPPVTQFLPSPPSTDHPPFSTGPPPPVFPPSAPHSLCPYPSISSPTFLSHQVPPFVPLNLLYLSHPTLLLSPPFSPAIWLSAN